MSLLRLPEILAALPGRLLPHIRRHWRPVVAALAVAGAAFWLYQVLVDQEGRMVYRLAGAEAVRLRGEVQDRLRERAEAIRRLALQYERTKSPAREAWERDAEHLLVRDLDLRAIEWVDTSLATRWLVPSTARVPGSILDPKGDAVRERELDAALTGTDPIASRSFPLPDTPRQLFLCAAIHEGERVSGYVVGIARARDIIDAAIADELKRGYSVAVYEGSFLIFGPVWLEAGAEAEFANDAELAIGDLSWRVMVWPSAELMTRLRSNGPLATLIVGFALALFVGFLVHHADGWKRRYLEFGAPPAA